MKIKLRKLWNGLASVRDYVVKDCIKWGQDLTLEFKGEIMTIKPEEMRQRMFQAHHHLNRSKFNPSQTYELIDFKFISDNEKKLLAKTENGMEQNKLL